MDAMLSLVSDNALKLRKLLRGGLGYGSDIRHPSAGVVFEHSSSGLQDADFANGVSEYACEFRCIPSRVVRCSVAAASYVRIVGVAREVVLQLLTTHQIVE